MTTLCQLLKQVRLKYCENILGRLTYDSERTKNRNKAQDIRQYIAAAKREIKLLS